MLKLLYNVKIFYYYFTQKYVCLRVVRGRAECIRGYIGQVYCAMRRVQKPSQQHNGSGCNAQRAKEPGKAQSGDRHLGILEKYGALFIVVK